MSSADQARFFGEITGMSNLKVSRHIVRKLGPEAGIAFAVLLEYYQIDGEFTSDIAEKDLVYVDYPIHILEEYHLNVDEITKKLTEVNYIELKQVYDDPKFPHYRMTHKFYNELELNYEKSKSKSARKY